MKPSDARNPYDGGNKPCASSEPHEPHTWTLAAIDGNYYDCPGVPEPPAANDQRVCLTCGGSYTHTAWCPQRPAATKPDSARVQRVRAGVYKAGRAEIRRVGSFWYVVGEPYTAYLSLLDALAFGVTP